MPRCERCKSTRHAATETVVIEEVDYTMKPITSRTMRVCPRCAKLVLRGVYAYVPTCQARSHAFSRTFRGRR